MATLFALIRKDFIRRWRSPVSTLVMLAFPFIMAGMIGSISANSSGGIPAITVFVLDRDGGLVGELLKNASTPSDAPVSLVLEEVGEEGFARMEQGEASAMLVLEEGFTDRALRGEEVDFRLIRNPAESIKPEIVEQGVAVLATYLDVAVKVLGEEIVELQDMFEADEMPPILAVTRLSARVYERMQAGSHYVFPPVVQIASTKEGDAAEGDTDAGPNVFGYILVMISVMSVLFVSVRAITEIYEDRRSGMMRRLLSTPVNIDLVLVSKTLFATLLGVVVMGILLISGAVLGWFGGSVPVVAVLLHTAAFSLAAAGLMVVLISLVKTEKQAGILSWIVVMAMSVLGGSMFPVENLPATLQQVARFTLNYHAVQGYLDLIVRGVDPGVVLRSSAAMAAVGLGLVILGQFLMRRRVREALA